jgi:hypothetical protein
MLNFKNIVVGLFKVEMFIGVLILPFILIRAIVLYSHADPESRMRARHLLVVVAELLLALVILPPLIGIVASILPSVSVSKGKELPGPTWYTIKGPGPGWIFTLLFSLLSWLITGLEAFLKNYVSLLTLPIIHAAENMDLANFIALDNVWKIFFAISMAIVLLSIGYNFVKDVIQEATGEETSSERGGTGVMVYLGRAVTGVVLAFTSYPIGKALIYLDGVIKNFMMDRVSFPGLRVYEIAQYNTLSALGIAPKDLLNLGKSIANAIAYMTLAPHTRHFAQALNLPFASIDGVSQILTLTDPYQAIFVGVLVSYSMVFLISMAAIFATRIVMVTFWFGIAPIVFAMGGSLKGKLPSISSWFTHFMTWAFFPSAVSIILYIVGAVVESLPGSIFGPGVTYSDNVQFYFMLFVFFAGMTVILKIPGILERLFSGIGNTIEGAVGSVISGIQRTSGL